MNAPVYVDIDNPNAPCAFETTPIFIATYNGHEDIVKFLAPLTDNPNAPNKNGTTPIQIAVFKGHNGIVQILESIKPNNTDRLKEPAFKKPKYY